MSSDSEKPVAEAKPETKPTSPPPAKPAPKPAAKKQEEKPIPVFEKGISEKIVEKFGDKVKVTFVKEDRVGINATKESVHEVAEFIRDALNYDHVESVSGVDYPADNEIEVVYHIGSYSDNTLARQVLELTTRAPRESNPIPGNDATKLPSLRDIFYSVEFHEREIFEMLGVYFEGHPDNRRLLLPEDWADLPPLRKDFAIKGR
ncbi:MAG: NADH-quinone oxidoreductase subunit C [Nitrosopumilus sp.]|uniref:NADH-quinone oxidoreductase subunit C n=1 Tax=Nitrosopumilus sp. TaxID=2024843 RepID=UPI00247B7599|nr:NADH-quinone oxidoreductase subunit C [Nitrosopumilus sp.]MCV0393125.1 NADH-quinone oxidoreductase subunit C [Nitrosopumilus sp.]